MNKSLLNKFSNLFKSCIYCHRLLGEFICDRCWNMFWEKTDSTEMIEFNHKIMNIDTGYIYNKATSHFWQLAKHKGYFRIIGSLVGH